MASAMAPLAVKPHAITLLSPKGASEAGSRNTPDPIELPTTNATHIQKPSRGRGAIMDRHYSLLTISNAHLTLMRNSGASLQSHAIPSYRYRSDKA